MTLTVNTNVALLDAVFAVTSDNQKVRVSDPAVNHVSVTEWHRLDDLRREGKFPHVKHFCVRRMDDPEWMDAPTSLRHTEPLLYKGPGFKTYIAAAKRAWKMWQGEVVRDSRTDARAYYGRDKKQGLGGWYFWHNGSAAAQGERGLEELCKRRGLVVQGVNGRYYPCVSKL